MSWDLGGRRAEKLTKDSVLKFGKYRGEKLGEVMDTDPKYLEWCLENVDWFAEAADEIADEIRDAADNFYDERNEFGYDEFHKDW